MKQANNLSKRGIKAAANAMRVDLDLYYQVLENPYHPEKNPTGAIPMNMAENHLGWELLHEKIQHICRQQTLTDWTSSYGDPAGVLSFREAVCGYFERFLKVKPLDPANLACSAGATAVIEMSSFLLANPGDTAVIPAPSYPVYTADLQVFSGVERYDLQVEMGKAISLVKLDEAKSSIKASGSECKLLILTQPDNPTGKIYTLQELNQLADWCISNEVHMIVNEIYGMSLIDTQHPTITKDYPTDDCFHSFLQVIEERKSPFLHFWYSFSKDLGISGFRVGAMYSHNQELIKGYRNVGLSHAISNYTQWLMQEVLIDTAFMDRFITHSQAALTENYAAIIHTLKSLKIPYTPSYGSLFVWANLSEFLQEHSAAGEEKLWLDIFHETGILLTPTNGFGHSEKGWYRMVISSQPLEGIQEAMRRLSSFLSYRRA